jgi:hypothetical protein
MKTLVTLGVIFSALVIGRAAQAKNGPINCYIQTYNGHYLTAVGGGGRVDDVIHSDATHAKSWEKFTLIDSDAGTPNIIYGIRTVKGYYLTAIDGGGRIQNVMHSDATQLRDWEQFQMISLGNGYYAIRTYTGNYLTAVGGGGRITDVIHSDAKQIGAWEKFRLQCGV